MLHEIANPQTPQPTPASVWDSAHRWLTIGLVLAISGAAFEALAVATILPATVKDIGGLDFYGWAFSAFMLANLIGITIAGIEADRQGPTRPFLAGIGAFIIGLLVVGFAPSMTIVIVGRAIQGFGAGVISSVSYTAIGRGYPEATKPRMLAILSSAWVVPGLIGPALAGLISDAIGWRWVFLGLIPFIALGGAMTLPGLRKLAGGSQAARDWSTVRSSMLLAVGAALSLSGLSQPVLPLAAAMVLGGLVIGGPALRRLLPAGTLRAAPGLPAAIASHGLLNLAFFGVDAFVPLALISVRGESASTAGITLTAATIAWSSCAWIQAHLAARWSRRSLVMLGLGLIAIGIVGIALVLSPSVPLVVAPIVWAAAGAGMGFAFSTNSLVVLETAPAGQEGTASSALQTANVLGTALGAGIGGVIIGSTDSAVVHTSSLVTHDIVMLCALLLAMYAASRLSLRPSESANLASDHASFNH